VGLYTYPGIYCCSSPFALQVVRTVGRVKSSRVSQTVLRALLQYVHKHHIRDTILLEYYYYYYNYYYKQHGDRHHVAWG
jgi:hypothetical protein